MSQFIHNRKALEEVRRSLRKEPTDAETLLWQHLRSSQLDGRKFRRQHSVGVYVLDFYCPAERLAIELDGGVHLTPEALLHDSERDEALAQLAIKTIRFINDEVETKLDSVLQKIRSHFTTKS